MSILDRIKFFYKRDFSTENYFKKELQKKLSDLQRTLHISIKNPKFYIKALTHSSFLDLHPEFQKSNERLEYLGDSVLSLVIGKYLFEKYPYEEEGFLTKSRSLLVNRESLASAADSIGLQNYILYNQRYLKDTVEGIQSILADALEAIIGAIYLDHGLASAEKFIINQLVKPLEEGDSFLMDTNYKGQLLEFTHAHKMASPHYIVTAEEGPAHNKEFTIQVFVGEELMGTGLGKNKKTAEQMASQTALQKLNQT
ncbi:MAG: ribonuclease III [Ignavibacteriales bacterium]|nr:ribonuclease III [Ignavibacteriales bacterium]